MRAFTTKTALGAGLALAVLVSGVTGCASHSQEKTDAATAGAAMQKSGTMSQGDYTRIRELGHTVYQTHTISDADLDWTLGLLNGAGNSVARARALTTLSEIRPMSAVQKAKILPAITPYLSSADKLDQVGAQRVQRAAQAGG